MAEKDNTNKYLELIARSIAHLPRRLVEEKEEFSNLLKNIGVENFLELKGKNFGPGFYYNFWSPKLNVEDYSFVQNGNHWN